MLAFLKANLPFLSAVSLPIIAYTAYKLYTYIELFFYSLQQTNRNGGELVANVLKSHGVKWIFTLIGGHISYNFS